MVIPPGAAPHLTVEINTDHDTVVGLVDHLFGAFDVYLKAHPGTQFPEVVMALVNFHRLMLSYQADQMRLSPEQRESYYQTCLTTLARSMQNEIQRLTDQSLVQPKTPGTRPTKRKRKETP